MSVILLILKIIGIVLLVLLGLLLITVFFLLFLPVQYRIIGNINESPLVRIKLSWLLRLFCCNIIYENKECNYKLRILGIPLKKKKDRTSKRKKFKKKKNIVQETKTNEVVKKEEYFEREVVVEKSSLFEDKKEIRKKRTVKKKKEFLKKIKSFPGMVKEKWEKLKEKIKNIKEIIYRIKIEIKDEANREAVSLLWKEIKYWLKHFSPRRLVADLSFGMDNPATTGQVLGVISTLPFVYKYQLHICPDFESEKFYIKGSFDVKGHIRVIHLLVSAIRLIRDKNIQQVISKFRDL